MNNMMNRKMKINGLSINLTGYDDLLNAIHNAAASNKKTIIAYANVNSINLCYKFPQLIEYLNSFDIVHPDGVGIRTGIKLLNRKTELPERITGSDLYPLIIKAALNNNFSFYFFGHDNETLAKIHGQNPGLIIKGYTAGYNYSDENVIDEVNSSGADILIVGLGTPKQEEWVFKNSTKLNSRVILIVGDGIKVFAGIKNRGPEFLRKAGLEWLWRFACNPIKYFNRYIIGNPLFLYRILAIKMRKLPG